MPATSPTTIASATLPRVRVRGIALALALVAGCVGGAVAAEDVLTIEATSPSAPLTLHATLPAVPLRGYGAVAGRHWTASGGGAVLEITCSTPEKAKLTLAKYLSDLEVLPGVTLGTLKAPELKVPRWGAATLATHPVQDQGVVLALRSGGTVFILTAPDSAGLQRLLGDLGGSPAAVAAAVSTAQTTVPMWLDRFDRHGFRFYYGPFTRPAPERMLPAGAKPETYDFTQDFAFAKDSGAGLLMWATQGMQGASEGVTNANWWGWVESWAKPLDVPIGVNLSAYNFDVPNWVVNRFRSELAQPMPQYLGDSMSIGGGRGTGGKVGELTWGATAARDALFGSLQQVARRFAPEPNIISWLEPHGEFYQGGDAFMGYGPAVDATFRTWLKEQYRTIAAVNRAWGGKLASFDAVRAPELAEFAGWSAAALDLAGTWRVGYPEGAAPQAWFAPGFDDAAWTTQTAPGDDHAFFTPRKAAVFRRAVDVPAQHAASGQRSWIYLWDLNTDWDKPVSIWLNGSKLGESPCRHPYAHWMVAEATAALRPGANQLALGLPQGYLGYRVYLSHTEPRQYPALGTGLNAKWVDYVAWREAMRMASARRGVEMIRAVDPERQIDFMAPAGSSDGLKGLAEAFGGNFKDTGFMGGLWAEQLPQLMRGSRLPFTLEPGGPPRSAPEMRRMLGLYHSEGIQGVDYFMHIGDVEWDPAIRQAFTATRPLWQAFGKYHCHPADLAILWDMGIDTLVGFPWGGDLNIDSGSGWSCRQIPESLLATHPRDGITEGDFARGNAARYKVVIDTNTAIMSDELLTQIEAYVRGGGTFITTGQTGRHAPATADAWPIARLTGYQVLSHETYAPETFGGPALPPPPGSASQPVVPAPGQQVYGAETPWMGSRYLNGLHLKRVAGDCQDLLLWKDGSVAVGMRQVGKGRIIQFGCKDGGSGVRIDPAAFFPILDWLGVARNQATFAITCADDANAARNCITREYVSNNGLFDVWMLFNDNRERSVEAAVVFSGGAPARAYDVLAGSEVPVTGGRLAGIKLGPFETRMFLTPRAHLDQAALDWFDLQRGWWRGTTPVGKPFPPPSERFHRSLDEGWSWRAVGEQDPVEAWAAPAFAADGAWRKTALGIISAPQQPAAAHLAFRSTITVPAEWKDGRVTLSLRSTGYPDFAGTGRLWIDGKLAQDWGGEAVDQIGAELFAPGSVHTLLIEAKSDGPINGFPGDCWLAWIPPPRATIDLAGTWATSPDLLQHFTGEVVLPGPYSCKVMRRTVSVPTAQRGQTAVVTIRATRAFGLIVNGTYIPFSGGPTKNGNVVAITPFLRYGADKGGENVIELVSVYDHCEVSHVSLDFYDPATGYP